MPAAGEPVTSVAHGAPAGGGWVYLQNMQVAPSPIKFDHYLHKQSVGLGVAQIVIGTLCIVFNIVSLAVWNPYYMGLGVLGHGFWCGVMFIVTGSFGISAGASKTKCKIVSYMVLCIISASSTTVLLSLGIIGAVVGGINLKRCNVYDDYGYSSNYRYYYRPPCSAASAVVAMESLLAICAFIAAILFIWGSALCCKAKPCCYNLIPIQQMPLPPNYVPTNGPHVTQSGQFVLPTMSYQPGVPPAYQPSPAQAFWIQPQHMQGTAAAAADPCPTLNPTQAFGQGYVQQQSELPPKY